MQKRHIRKAIYAVSVAAFLIGAQSAAAETIRMWTFLDPSGKSGRAVALKQMIASFEAANPGDKVQVEPQVWQQMGDKFLAANQTGTAPDVIWTVVPRLPGTVDSGALANLDELFMKDWSAEELADVNDAYYQYKAKEGAHYQMTGSRSVFGQCYRADLLEKAGIDPNDLQSWDAFIAAAQKMQAKDANGNQTIWGFAQSFVANGDPANHGISTIVQLNGHAFNDDGKPDWANEAGVKAVQLYVDMVHKYKITPPEAVSMASDDVYDQFTAGRAVFARCSSARVTRLGAALGDKGSIGYMPTPSFVPGEWSPTEVSGWTMGVWSKSENKELAGEFVKFMTNKAADELWVKVGGQVPMRQSTLKANADFFALPENAHMVVIADTLKNSSWFPPDNAVAGKNNYFLEAVQEAVTNNVPPMEALETAEKAYIRANRL